MKSNLLAKKSILFLLIIIGCKQINAQSHAYNFNGTLNESVGVGPALTEVFSCAAVTGNFNSQLINITTGNCGTATAFSFNEGGGFSYPNTTAFINENYTIHIFFKFNALTGYQRIIDFKNSTTDRGLYTLSDCLNFYPNGNVGTCPFFVANNFYLVTLVRDGGTKLMTIYVNGILFSTYTDAADDYVPTTTTTPIIIFRDDNAVPCEDRSGTVKYFELKPTVSSAAEVASTFNSICTLILPLTITDFSGKILDKKVLLSWKTEHEINTERFEVERSVDGIGFVKAGTVAAKNAVVNNNYQFEDAVITSSALFYRLKTVDKDGSFVYSSIIKLSPVNDWSLSVSPSPAIDVIQVKSNTMEEAFITNTSGQLVRKIKLTIGTNSVNISELSAGLYFIRTANTFAKFIKK